MYALAYVLPLAAALPPVMWFQPSHWGQPAPAQGSAPLDPPDPSSSYLATLDRFLRPRPDTLSVPGPDSSAVPGDEAPMLIWLGRWREWLQGPQKSEQPTPLDAGGEADAWWSQRMQAIKQLYRQSNSADQRKDQKTKQEPALPSLPLDTLPVEDVNALAKFADQEILLPARDILDNLDCRPLPSFQACLDHCASIIPPNPVGRSLTRELIPWGRKSASNADLVTKSAAGLWDLSDPSPIESLLDESTAHKILGFSWRNDAQNAGQTENATDASKRPNSPTPSQDARDNSAGDGLEAWQVSQLKSCIFGICVPDYLIKPVPGCLGADGRVVPLTDGLKKIRDDPDPADNFEEYNFYNPGRLELWRGLGFYVFVRWWHQFTGGSTSPTNIVFFPLVVLLAFFALPALLIAIVLPVVSRLMASSVDEDGATMVCEADLRAGQVEDMVLRMAEPLVAWLGNLGQYGSWLVGRIGTYLYDVVAEYPTAESFMSGAQSILRPSTVDKDEISLEMTGTNSPPPVTDLVKKRLVTHGESGRGSHSAATIDTI